MLPEIFPGFALYHIFVGDENDKYLRMIWVQY
ncbi:hypothetical protein FORC31_0857 [Escherichia coli]|nr:hypothetical protein FORC31_0857 [Escherichia coli]